jgi:hypothetical protein
MQCDCCFVADVSCSVTVALLRMCHAVWLLLCCGCVMQSVCWLLRRPDERRILLCVDVRCLMQSARCFVTAFRLSPRLDQLRAFRVSLRLNQ